LLAFIIRIYHDARSYECHVHKMHLQVNTNIAPLIVHHAFQCYVDGGNKSKHFVRGRFLFTNFHGHYGGVWQCCRDRCFATNREVRN